MKNIFRKAGSLLLAAAVLLQSFGINVSAAGDTQTAEKDIIIEDTQISDSDQEMVKWILENLAGQEDTLDEKPEEWWESLSENQRLAAEIFAQQPTGESAAAYLSGAYTPSDGDQVAYMSLSSTGYTDGLGNTFWKISNGGSNAYCMDHGSSLKRSYAYGNITQSSGAAQYLINTYGAAANSTEWYMSIQMAVWALLAGQSASSVYTYAFSWFIKGGMDSTQAAAWAQTTKNFFGYAEGQNGTCYIAQGPAGSQRVGKKSPFTTTVYSAGSSGGEGEEPEEPEIIEPEYDTLEDSISVSYQVNVKKTDWQTDVGLGGCKVDIFENGSKIATITTASDGNASYRAGKSQSYSETYCSNYDELDETMKGTVSGFTSKAEAQASIDKQKAAFSKITYTYSCRENTAPKGYVWEANENSAVVGANGSTSFSLTNERTLGSVDLIKYDTESESDITQGDGTLQGAVYGIYAAEDIVHQDQKTGILFAKDSLVATAEIGRSPVQSEEGFLLNEDGSRHIDDLDGTVAYKETPGRTAFADLELGSYYIKEITPSEGYLLDQTVYPVTFTYKDQHIKVETRDEAAAEVQNTLTVDDGCDSKTVYSGDYVKKQGIQFVKTSDNTYQTELTPIEGAGFSVYLISSLSGVKNGSIQPVNEVWGTEDILTFYDYDFTGESRAVLYKRSLEPWTEGDTKWLKSLGGAKYEVGEMFTDENGRIETPELPFGTYVVVETTTPENHVSAKPFIVVIDQDSRSLQKQRIINNTITKAFLRIVKADEEFLVQPDKEIQPEEVVRGSVLKEGASYRLKCLSLKESKESLIALNWKTDSDGYLSYYDPNAKAMSGTLQHPFVTSFYKVDGKIRDCYITLPQELPVGTYELEELTAPEGYVLSGREQKVEDTGTDRVNAYEIMEEPAAKTVFAIGNGSVYPDGQMGTNKYALQDAYGNLTVTVLQKNREQKGIVEISKHGEQLVGVEAQENGNLHFLYEDAPVEGAQFEVVAAEDIYTQEIDQQTADQYEADAAAYRIYKKGEVAATITTDRYGWGYAANLYIGKYLIRETAAGSGFVLNTQETEFEITSQEQTVSFDIQAVEYQNERQKLELNLLKTAQDSKKALAGAVFGLYAKEDICTQLVYDTELLQWMIAEESKLLVEKDGFICKGVTDSSGKIVFEGDLPLGKYYVKELQAPTGYLLNEETIEIDASYDGEQGGQNTALQVHTIKVENQRDPNVPVTEPEIPVTPTPENPKEEPETEQEEEPELIEIIQVTEQPKTGDSSRAALLMLLCIGAAGGCYIIWKKRKN